jgi:Putative Ig domain
MKFQRSLSSAFRKVSLGLTVAALALASFVAIPKASAQTYFNLAAGSFTEDFATISTWSSPSTGSWSGFVAGGTGTIPDPNKITQLVTTGSTVFATSSSGGIQKGTQTMLLLATGSDNVNATAIDLLLNFTGRNAGNLSFDAAELANSTGNRQGTLSVYASVDGSSWTAVTGTNLPFIATNNVTSSASINVALPALLNNQAQGRLRFYYHVNPTVPTPTPAASGSRPKISIDNVMVTSTPSVAGIPMISSASTDSVTANSPYTYTIVASNSPTSYNAAPLPAGLSINTATGVISGTPTTPGASTITLSATNGTGTGQGTLNLTVNIDPAAAAVTAGQTIPSTLNVTITPYQIVTTGSPTLYGSSPLPAGLTLDTGTGIISGTPTVPGTYTVTITATNAAGSGTATISIVVSSSPLVTGELTASTLINTAFTYTLVVNEQTDFPTTGVYWPVLPAGLAKTTAKVITGTPTTPGTYNLAVDVVNDIGTTSVVVTLFIIDQATQDAIPHNVVINEYVNATPDKVELLVVGTGSPGSTVDMRGMVIKDYSSNMGTDNGGKFVFANSSLWSAVPAGTLIVLSNGTTEVEDLVVSDFLLRVNLGDTDYFTSYGTFDIATTEMVELKAAGYGTLGSAGGIHAMATGVAGAYYTAFTGPKIIATGQSGTNAGVFANNTTSTLADFNGTDATGNIALASLTFGTGNNTTNQTYINSLRTAPLSALETWRAATFAGTAAAGSTATIGLGADAADYDGDGIANLIEYATGTDAKLANASPLTLGQSGSFLTLSYPVIADGTLVYTVGASSDLATGFTPGGGTINTVGGIATYTDNMDITTGGAKRFLRLGVSH